MLAQSEMYQAGFNDYMNGECNAPSNIDDAQEYLDGWYDGQFDADTDYDSELLKRIELTSELYENEHLYFEQ